MVTYSNFTSDSNLALIRVDFVYMLMPANILLPKHKNYIVVEPSEAI